MLQAVDSLRYVPLVTLRFQPYESRAEVSRVLRFAIQGDGWQSTVLRTDVPVALALMD